MVRERQKRCLQLARDESFLAPDLRVLVEVDEEEAEGARCGDEA